MIAFLTSIDDEKDRYMAQAEALEAMIEYQHRASDMIEEIFAYIERDGAFMHKNPYLYIALSFALSFPLSLFPSFPLSLFPSFPLSLFPSFPSFLSRLNLALQLHMTCSV